MGMDTAAETTARRRRGRPRDPDVERRVLDAALERFGTTGWSGFSMDAVARRAGVGKATLYRRWPTKAALLLDALATQRRSVRAHDTGNVRDDLVGLATDIARTFETQGFVPLRVFLEGREHPALLADFQARVTDELATAARAVVHRAVARRELPQDASAAILVDAIAGGVIHRTLRTAGRHGAGVAPTPRHYLEALVDLALAGAHHGPRRAR